MEPYIAVDLDDTLATYNKGMFNQNVIGEPIPAMVGRVKHWLKEGKRVKIFTARVSMIHGKELEDCIKAIQNWCEKHIGQVLEITCYKDYGMVQLWDDRAVQVVPGTGEVAAAKAYKDGYTDGYKTALLDSTPEVF